MNMYSGGNLTRHINILNLFILIALIGFCMYFLYPILTMPLSLDLPSPKEVSSEMQVSADKTTKSPISDYTLIVERNLFHPDRVMLAEKVGKVEKKAAISVPRPELVLHGTMMINGLKIAYVEDKKATPTTPGRGVRQLVVKEGDNIGGFILKQISENMIIFANGEEQMTLYLDELKDRKGEITGSTKALSPAMTVQPYVAPRQSVSQPAQRTPTMQSVPSAVSSPPSGSVSQPSSTGAPADRSRLPAMPSLPPVPLTPGPSPRS
jgi:hypothetical protein